MKKEIVSIPGVAQVKHLSRAVKFGNMVFVAGTTGRPLTGGEMPVDITGQAKIALENIKTALEAAGTNMANVLKTTCYLVDMKDRPAFNEVYITYFPKDPPARACFAVGALAEGVKLEIEAIACIPD